MLSNTELRSLLEKAIDLAKEAFDKNNYPIGTIFVDENGNELLTTQNECFTENDITAHAEIVGIRKLGKKVNKDSDKEIILISSLEPCFGCSFFIARTNIKSIYSALKDPHKGGISDLKAQKQFENFFKDIEIENDLFEDLKEESREVMMKYFLKIGRTDTASYYGYKFS